LLTTAPNITLLATSRERLQLAEEWVFPVTGLDAALELFGQTAVRVQPNFDMSVEETAVHHICQLVENLPLAVELAASWTPFLTCAQIAEHIQNGLDILATTVRNIPARHRSMQAVFATSWQLLTETEREALMRLSVFRGGWRVEEATACRLVSPPERASVARLEAAPASVLALAGLKWLLAGPAASG
jgi:predicted ATPase